MTATFFGHKNAGSEIKPLLRKTVQELIDVRGVKNFYVGHHGHFDAMALDVLRELSKTNPISYCVVLSNLNVHFIEEGIATEFPEGIETVPRRLSIIFCNRYQIIKSDFVVTYVTHTVGSGAAKSKEAAIRAGKTVIELSEMPSADFLP